MIRVIMYSWWEISSGSIHSCFYHLSTTLPPLRAGSVPIQPSAIPGRAVLLLSHVGPILHWEGCGCDNAVDLAAAATEAARGCTDRGPTVLPCKPVRAGRDRGASGSHHAHV